MIVSSESADVSTMLGVVALLRGQLGERAAARSCPMTPFIGVRISWLMLARNSLLARLAPSAACLARCISCSACLRVVMSIMVPSMIAGAPAGPRAASRFPAPTPACRPCAGSSLDVGEAFQLHEPRDELLAVAGVEPHLGGVVGQVLLARGIAEDTETGLVDVQHAPIDRAPVDAGQAALEEQPVAALARLQLERLRGKPPIDHRGEDREGEHHERDAADADHADRRDADRSGDIAHHRSGDEARRGHAGVVHDRNGHPIRTALPTLRQLLALTSSRNRNVRIKATSEMTMARATDNATSRRRSGASRAGAWRPCRCSAWPRCRFP